VTLDAQGHRSTARIAIDIGSTVVKVALIGEAGDLISQQFHPRDFEAGILRQVESLLGALKVSQDRSDVLACSSANGGLRVGIVCLTKYFSGAVLRDQVLSAGANPVFVRDFDEDGENPSYVDILLVGGGIDCPDAAPLEHRIRRFQPENYRYGALLFAGNKYLADMFCGRFPRARVVPNPLAEQLANRTNYVFEVVRRAYLDDLVYKEGVSELSSQLSRGIRPTPEIVNLGFQRATLNRSNISTLAPCVLLDIGGATTDLHYTVEIVRDDSEVRPPLAGHSVARYVFTDLGIVASRDSLMLQLRSHPRLYDLLREVLSVDVTESYRLFREGEYQPSPALLSYGCLFLALDRFAHGRGPGLPSGDLNKVAQIILTGGGAQALSEDVVARVVNLQMSTENTKPVILIDRRYQVWVEGIAWSEHAVAVPAD
jgi:hypothetical protein